MTPERILQESADAGESADLRKRRAAAEGKVAGARKMEADATDAETNVSTQQARIRTCLTDLSTLKRSARLQAAQKTIAVLDSVKKDADLGAALAQVNRESEALAERGRALENAIAVLTAEAANRRCKTIQAEITVNQASIAWVTAAAHADLHDLIAAMAPAMECDPSLTINVDGSSKAFAYSSALNDLQQQATELENKFREAREICQHN
jgi:hypothetical protein